MIEDTRFIWKVAGCIVALLVIVSTVTVTLIYAGSSYSCMKLQEQTALDTRYSFWTGCMVNIDGDWVPKERWINIQGDQ